MFSDKKEDADKGKEIPKTGDTDPALLGGIALLGMGAFVVMCVARHRA